MTRLNLPVPYDHAAEVIRVVHAGLAAADVSETVRRDLTRFCDRSEQLLDMPPSNVKRVGLGDVLAALDVVEEAGLTETANLLRAFVRSWWRVSCLCC